MLSGNLSRVIAPILRAAAVALVEEEVAAVLAQNAIAAERLVTLLVRAPRHPEVAAVQEVATAVAGEEATVALAAGAVKKHGALSLMSPEGY